jgi:pimeloyl-ACP methyl ester carboxylesterase
VSEHVVVADDGAELAAEVTGPEDPSATVVLAHGWTLTRRSWRDVVRRVATARPDVRLVAYDQRDHGRSRGAPSSAGRASIARLADDLATVVAALAPAGPLVLGGHSMGGMTVLALAGRRPELVAERVDGVLLANTAADQLARRLPLTLAMRALAAAPARLRVPRVPSVAAHRLGYGSRATRDLVRRVRDGVPAPSARSVGTWFGALMDHDERESLAHLADVPVILLAGETDRLTPRRHAEAIARALPHARYEVVPGTGHMLLFEHPDLVAHRLLGLLPPPSSP